MISNSRSPKVVYIAVSLCFFLSGFAALLYQMAWMRQLSVVFGTSELAVATVLAAYMAGLAMGAAAAARLMNRIRRPIVAYGVLEATIALSAIAVPFLLQLAAIAYASMFGGLAQPPDAGGFGQTMEFLQADRGGCADADAGSLARDGHENHALHGGFPRRASSGVSQRTGV